MAVAKRQRRERPAKIEHWKVGLPLQSKPGNQLSSRDDLGCTELSTSCCAEISLPLDLRRVSQGISGVA